MHSTLRIKQLQADNDSCLICCTAHAQQHKPRRLEWAAYGVVYSVLPANSTSFCYTTVTTLRMLSQTVQPEVPLAELLIVQEVAAMHVSRVCLYVTDQGRFTDITDSATIPGTAKGAGGCASTACRVIPGKSPLAHVSEVRTSAVCKVQKLGWCQL